MPAESFRSFHRCFARSSYALLLLLVPWQTTANPIPAESARLLDSRPMLWLSRPVPELERQLLFQFGSRGLAFLSRATLDSMERHLDRFAPLLIAGQSIPRFPHRDLQDWFRAHATVAQAESMKAALREWLEAPVNEAPVLEETIDGSASRILDARLAAAEALGDWRDSTALPSLRKLLRASGERRSIVVSAIRRITDPDRRETLRLEADGRLTSDRPARELDSLIVTCRDDVTSQSVQWRADASAVERILRSLSHGRLPDRERRGPGQEGSFRIAQLMLAYHDGSIATLERFADEWCYEDNTRRSGRHIWFVNPRLDQTVDEELTRAGVAPRFPRFVAESVTLTIDSGELRVHGFYEFEGRPPNGPLEIDYPFPTSQRPPEVDSCTVSTNHRWVQARVPFTLAARTCHLELDPPVEASSYTLEVDYRQRLEGRSATYLIRTDKEWGRPLHRAWFQVILPDSLGAPRFSLPFREVPEGSGRRRFLFEAAPFRSDSDLVVRW